MIIALSRTSTGRRLLVCTGRRGRVAVRLTMRRHRVRASWAGQRISVRAGRRVVAMRRRKAVAVRTVQLLWLTGRGTSTAATVERLRRHEGLSLGRHGREDAFLAEADAVGAAAVLGVLEARASDLRPS